MAQNPIGTIADEDRLVALREDEDGFSVDVTEPVETADVSESGTFAWVMRAERDVPRLVLAPVEDDADAGDLATRELSGEGDALTVDVPETHLAEGLYVDVEAYDDDNPLLFKPREVTDGVPVGMEAGEPAGTVERAVELVPVRFADGTPYREEPLAEASMDSDPVAEAEMRRDRGEDAAPQSATITAPVDGEVVDAVLLESDAPRADVVSALETMTRRDTVSVADDETEYEPIVADDRAVVALTEETWRDAVAAELDVPDSAVETAREIHERETEQLLRRTDTETGRFEDHVPVVVQPDRLYDSDEPPQ